MAVFTLFCIQACCWSASQCEDRACHRNYIFKLPFTFSPAQDTFHIGDTIVVAANFSNEFVDIETGEAFILKDFKSFFTEINLTKIDVSPLIDANPIVTFTALTGNINYLPLVTDSSHEIEYSYNEPHYQFAGKMILNAKGLFTLTLPTSSFYASENLNRIDLTDCKNEFLILQYKMNDNEDENNFHLLQGSADLLVRGTSSEVYRKSGQYTFIVVD